MAMLIRSSSELNIAAGIPVPGAYYYDRIEKIFVQVLGFVIGVDYEEGSHSLVRYQRLHDDTELPIGPEMVRSFASWMSLDEYMVGSAKLDFRFAPAEKMLFPAGGSAVTLEITEDHEIG